MCVNFFSQLHIYMGKRVLVKNYHYGNDYPNELEVYAILYYFCADCLTYILNGNVI